MQTIIDATGVNTNKTGIYQVIYEAIDTSGNKADTLARAIHIVDYAILQEKIQYILTLVESDYTVDTWQKLQEIVAEIKK